MSDFEFLQKYVRLQQGIMFDEVINLGFALVGYSLTDKSGYWNNALTNKVLNRTEISRIEELLTSKGRNPSVYFENNFELKPLAETLTELGFKKEWEDCWQFWDKEKLDNRFFESVREVKTPEDLKVFLNTFNSCYQKDDPKNPYGELGDYLRVAESVWHKHRGTKRLEYFIAFRESEPVAVSTLTNFEHIGYISNVGSLKEVRGKGYGKAATLFCVDRSIQNGNLEHCLATEEDAYPNEFYKRIGFMTRFTAKGYTRKIYNLTER